MVTVNCNTLCRYRKRVCYLVLLISQHANGCYLFCLNRKLPDLTFINKFLIVMFILFALNFNIQSSGVGITSRFHSVLKFSRYCGICRNFLRYCGVQNRPMPPSFYTGWRKALRFCPRRQYNHISQGSDKEKRPSRARVIVQKFCKCNIRG